MSPGTGNQLTTFSFNVTYVDLDNNEPASIEVYINGTAHSMYKQNSSDTDYTDGCTFVYPTKFPHVDSTYVYYFTCSDGKYANTTGTYTGPAVTETNTRAPMLLDAQVSPLQGTNATAFNFTVTYSDLDNNLATWVTITINSSTYSMVATNPLDSNVLDGKTYYYTTTLPWGLYRFQCNCSDGTLQNATRWVYSPIANPFEAIVSTSIIFYDNFDDGSFGTDWTTTGWAAVNTWTYNSSPYSACHGEGAGEVTSRVISLNGQSSANISYWVRRGGAFGSSEHPDATGEDLVVEYYTNTGSWVQLEIFYAGNTPGEIFTRNLLLPTSALHAEFRIRFRQLGGSGTSFDYWHFDDVLIRTNGYAGISLLAPVNGSCFFNGNIRFSWASLSPPFTPITYQWQLSNSSTFSTIVEEQLSIVEIPGNTSIIRNIDQPTSTYYWRVRPVYSVFQGNWSTYSNFTLIHNDLAPGLSSGSVSPGTGNQLTTFSFNVTYVDLDNNEPASIEVYINGTAHSMYKQNSSDTDYTDGCTFVYPTKFPHVDSTYVYYFTCSDGKYANTTGTYTGPAVTETNTHAPILLDAQVSPLQGTNATAFNFTVTYSDLDNNLATWVTITINSSTYSMVVANPLDSNVLDGKTYYYTTTLPWGLYRFQCNCSDGTFQNGTSWIDAPESNPFNGLSGSLEIENVAIFRDSIPWGYTIVADRLGSLGIAYTVYGSSSLGAVSLAAFDKVIIESEQYTSFYTVLVQPAVRSWLETYISSGGVLEMHFWHQSSQSIPGTLPGGYTEIQNSQASFTINPAFLSHPLMAGVASGGFDGGSYSMQYLTGMKGSEDEIVYDNSLMQPRLFTREFGNGLIIYMGFAVEFGAAHGTGSYSTFLTNLLQYGTRGGNVVNLILPANGSHFCTGNVTFTWSSLELPFGPITYHWQLSNTSDFSEILMEEWDITGTAENTSILKNIDLPTGMLYWRVRPLYDVFQGNWSSWNSFTFLRNYFSPTLSGESVSPSIGNQTTVFNFTVTYTDSDNNAPSYVRVFINGTYWEMSKQNGSDTDYTDGCVYVYNTTLSPMFHTHYFSTSDGFKNASTSTYSEPTVTNDVPTLTHGMFFPGSGSTSMLFNFSVVYADGDNNAPSYVRVYLNASYFNMVKQNNSDVTYTDGCVYVFLTYLPPGNYSIYFETHDGFVTNATQPFSGPMVINIAPTLTSASVTPNVGNYYSTFIFRVVYTDADNDAPGSIYLTFNNNAYPMSKLDGTDSDYTNGCIYYWQTSYLSTGTYSYRIIAWDGFYTVATPIYAGPTVNTANSNPSLSSWSVSPGTGNIYTTFVYRVVYTDAQNDAPYYIRVYIDGSYYSMSKQDSSDYTYTDGCIYFYTRTLSTGTHTYYFYANDGYTTTTTSTVSAPSVDSTNTAPVLTSGSLSSASGNTYTTFVYRVVYTDAQNDAPYYMYVYIDGSSYSMSKQNSSDNTYTDGCTYYYSRTLSIGTHTYYFYAYDGYTTTTTSTVSAPSVGSTNTAPVLSAARVSPTIGSPAISYYYYVTYTDAENDAPYYMRVYVDGSSYSSLYKWNSSDLDYTDGCVYYYSRTLSIGQHSFYFLFYDGTTYTQSPTLNGPSVQNNAPLLTSGSVSPTNGTTGTYFIFTVTYTDADNNAPLYVRVYIDGAYYGMSFLSGADYMYTDGCVYVYNTTLSPGSHNYYFSTSDGYSTNTTSTFSGLTVTNNAPTLTPGYVSPGSGFWRTTFTYTVTYIDSDNNPPSYVQVIIDGYSYSMSKQNSYDYTYTDGCVYVCSLTLSSGSHNYFYYASDGYATTTTPTYSGPTVQANRTPTLTSITVSPSTGDARTSFTFSITYTDADNDAPAYIRLYIDGNYRTLDKQMPTDNIYTDGVVYTIQLGSLTVGSHPYSFQCSDGDRYTSTSSQTLSVTRYSSSAVTAVILVLVFLIAVPLFIGITATKLYNKKKGITHAASTTLYTRPSPSFPPASYGTGGYNSTPAPSPARPAPGYYGTGGSASTPAPSAARLAPATHSPGSQASTSTPALSITRPSHATSGSGGWTSSPVQSVARPTRPVDVPLEDPHPIAQPRPASVPQKEVSDLPKVLDEGVGASLPGGATKAAVLLAGTSSAQETRVPRPARAMMQETSPPSENAPLHLPATATESNQQEDAAATTTIDEIEKQLIAVIAPDTIKAVEGTARAKSPDALPGGAEAEPQANVAGTHVVGDELDADNAIIQDRSESSLEPDGRSTITRDEEHIDPSVGTGAIHGEQAEMSAVHQGNSEKEADRDTRTRPVESGNPPVETASPVLVAELQDLEQSLLEDLGGATKAESGQHDKQVPELHQDERISEGDGGKNTITSSLQSPEGTPVEVKGEKIDPIANKPDPEEPIPQKAGATEESSKIKTGSPTDDLQPSDAGQENDATSQERDEDAHDSKEPEKPVED